MFQQKKYEETKQQPLAYFPTETEGTVPFHHEHYEALHPKHKEQTVFTYIPSIRQSFNGEAEDFDDLPREQRFMLYELIMLGRVRNLWAEIERLKARRKYEKKVKRSSSKKVNEILELIDGNPKIRAEDLIHALPKRVFSKLMLYVKYAGNDPATIRRFFENMEK